MTTPLTGTDPSPLLQADERLDTVNDHIRLIQKKNGLTFGTDAYLLAAYIRPMPRAHAVELGSGTGIIPLLLLARQKVARVTAVEIQPTFAELIRRNAEENGRGDTLIPLCHDIRTLTPRDLGEEVPLVFSNPPYMTANSGKRNLYDEKYIARHELNGGIAEFCAAAARLLKHGGRFVCVWRPDRLSDLFRALHASKLEPKRMTMVHADGESEPSCVLLEAVKGAAPGMRPTPPLFLYECPTAPNAPRILTPRAQKIYDTCLFSD